MAESTPVSDPPFAEQDAQDVATWLLSEGVPENVCKVFEDNEIDGEGFLDLTEGDIKSLVPPDKLGVVKKICRLKASVQAPKPQQSHSSSSSPGPSPLSGVRALSPLSSPLGVGTPSPLGSPFSRQRSPDSDDTASVASSASALAAQVFQIPKLWRPSIMACFNEPDAEEQKKLLSGVTRNEIVRDLVTQMYAYNSHPDKAFCTTVAKALVKKYPFLKDSGSNVSGFASWEKKIAERVHNVRSASSRKRPPSDEAEGTPRKKGRPKTSTVLSRYPTLKYPDVGNDDISIQRNMKLLQKEVERDKPRKEMIVSLQQQTFVHRREEVLSESEGVTVTAILKAHPVLTLPYAIELEMDLILEKKDVAKTSCREWQTKWTPAIIRHSETLTGKPGAVYKTNQKACEGGTEADEKLAFLQLCALLQKKGATACKPYIYEECEMSEDPNVVCTKDPPRTAPRFARFVGDETDTFFLFVERVVLCTTTTFTRALMLWFITHYVFNLQYSKQVREVALFFQESVFGLHEKKNKSSTYLTVTSDINKYV